MGTLTESQIERFHTEGYVCAENAVTSAQLTALEAALAGWVEEAVQRGENFGETIDGRARFEEATEGHHDHLIDIQSGEIIEFSSDEIEGLQRQMAEKLGFKLVDHRLELYGVPLKTAGEPESGETT